MWRAIDKGSEALKRISSLLEALQQCLRTKTPLPKELKPWLGPRAVCEFWAANASGFLNVEHANGVSGSDLLFFMLAMAMTVNNNNQQQQHTPQCSPLTLVRELQKMAITDTGDAMALLNQCVATIVGGYWAPPTTAKKLNSGHRPFGLFLGDPEDVYKGDEDDADDALDTASALEKAALLQAELEKQQEEVLPAQLLSWSSRVFLDEFYVSEVLGNQFPVAAAENFADDDPLPLDAYMKWAEQRVKETQPAIFYKRASTWVFRQICPIGAKRRADSDQDLCGRYTTPGKENWEELIKLDSIDIDPRVREFAACSGPLNTVLCDQKHPFFSAYHLALSSTLFDSICGPKTGSGVVFNTDGKHKSDTQQQKPPPASLFHEEFVIFRDQVVDSAAKLSTASVNYLPRPPLIVQTRCWGWVVHHTGKWYRNPLRHFAAALLIWRRLMYRDCENRTAQGIDISAWSATIAENY